MKSIKDIFTDTTSLLKLLEVIFCFLGLIFFEFSVVFYARWVMETLIIGLGGYLLISIVLFVTIVRDEDVDKTANLLFMILGAILNLLGGVMTMVRHSQRKKFIIWMYVSTAGLSDDSGGDYEVFVAIFALGAGVVMLIDFLKSF